MQDAVAVLISVFIMNWWRESNFILVSFQSVTEERIVLKYGKVAAYLHEINLKIGYLFMKVISIVDSVVLID